MDIYEILKSRPHDQRYLDRYVRFIKSRMQNTGPSEKHHICPKALDLFPQYSSFKEHPWNRIDLTPKEHYIAHLLLWKAFGGSQSYAIRYMRPKNRSFGNRSRLGISLSEETKAKMSLAHKGRSHTAEQKAKMSVSRTGKKFSEESKAKMRASALARNTKRNHQSLQLDSLA